MIDLSTEFGQRVARRLEEEYTVWLTTVDASGTPQPRPVWYLWDDESFLIYSRPHTHKLDHIQRNPHVALHFDSNGRGGDIVVFAGEARVADDMPPADQVPDYIDKYRLGLERLDMTPEGFARSYAVPIRVTPTKLRGD
jgi:PPOX class probable F420-dependent enzyme